MKNIHILPTDKPSRLQLQMNGKYHLENGQIIALKSFHNIYITNDEIPKIDEWGLNIKNNVIFKSKGFTPDDYDKQYCKKIILTTDQDLIKYGVQAIDDEFLEWFVKNPSCELVEVDKEEDELVSPKNPKIRFNALQDPPSFISAESLNNMILTYKYKIIIPQEEPKQEALEEAINNEINNIHINSSNLENIAKYNRISGTLFSELKKCMINIAKWQQEQDKNKYSRQDLIDFVYFINGRHFNKYTVDTDEVDLFIEQSKNK